MADLNSDPTATMSAAMSNPSSQPGIYKIFCLLTGEKNTFIVKIAREETVAELKDEIKQKKSNRLTNVDANLLEL